MAKSDIAKNGRIFFKGDKYRRYACDITMTQIGTILNRTDKRMDFRV